MSRVDGDPRLRAIKDHLQHYRAELDRVAVGELAFTEHQLAVDESAIAAAEVADQFAARQRLAR